VRAATWACIRSSMFEHDPIAGNPKTGLFVSQVLVVA
jgi:hypothetical protein